MDTITLSGEQKALLKVMEETKQHLFITGRAGAGKSVLLRHFREQTKKRIVVAAPTGIAALNVQGQTLHSLFKLAPALHRKGDVAPNAKVCTLLKRIDTLVIDEISMVRADLLDAVDERLREAFRNTLPFGGVQVIMFGDVYQLPPVVEQGLVPYFEAVHAGHFFFNALVWKQAEFKVYELSQVFRQKDPVFKDILNAVRDGSVTAEQIEQLNARCVPIPSDGTVTLAPTNSLVTTINQQRLDQLPGKVHEYNATITGEMKRSVFPTEEHLQLKVGAQIVLLKNDKNSRWVNGTVGKIEKLFDDHIDVGVNGLVYTLERETWEEVYYTYDHETQKVEAKASSSFTQYPIRLAWALTVHKSQGQTYESVALDLTTATFAAGQLYVALSRATSLEGLYLKLPVKPEHVMVEPKVIAFMLRREAIAIAAVAEEVQTVAEELHHDLIPELQEQMEAVVVELSHDEIIASVDEVQEQTNVVVSDSHSVNVFHHDAIEERDDAGPSFLLDEPETNHLTIISFPAADHLEISSVEQKEDAVEGEVVDQGDRVLVALPSQSIEVPTSLQEAARVGRLLAIEVLCPHCGAQCVDKGFGSPLITENLVGHSVVCSGCGSESLVPLNAFLMVGDVVAREKPSASGLNNKEGKKGRTPKPKKSNAGRKAKSGFVRQPRQLSLDVRTIQVLDVLGVNNSDLFETLLRQYEPFLNAWAELGYETVQEDESDE